MSDMFLFANVNLVLGRYDDWQAGYDKLAEYVWHEEHTTKTYYFGIPFDYASDFSSTTLMFAFEVYENMAALTDIHLKSPAMNKFLEAALPCMTTGLDLQYYSYVAGFLDRAERYPRDCSVMHDMRIHCTSAEARVVVEEALSQIADAVDPTTCSAAGKEEEEEGVGSQEAEGEEGRKRHPGIYTWLLCRSNTDDKEVRVYSRFRFGQDLRRYLGMPLVRQFWEEHGKKEVATMQQRQYVPNQKGWLHR